MNNKIIAAFAAITLVAGMIPVTFADVEAASVEPELTVVAKRITDDDNYMEISLEVNGDYEDYSSVGVVLQYDPALIVPTTWDDEAAALDMTENTSWATRRALPTLGKDTWSTHTALTYISSETDSTTNTTTQTGYLYLGAEYPGIYPNSSSEDDTSSNDTDTDTAATATATPAAESAQATAEPEDDPYTNPVVVARFKYADENAKSTIESKWTSGNWDSDWTKNTILTVAPDAISSESPAQYGFAIYNADFSMKGYLYDFTTDTSLETSEQADADDIAIVLGEGESAKSGGLSLNDIYVTMFYDWDDTLIGSLTCGVGSDATESVNSYIQEKFIHPDLQGNTDYSSTARIDNYRGEYPSAPNSDATATGGTNSVTDGEDYPLTNKLDYCFAGKTFHTDAPYAGGWTHVTASNMSDTWTALDSSDNFALPAVDETTGAYKTNATTGAYVDSSGNDITMPSCDFANITSDDIDGGVFLVKAVYTPGENLNYGGKKNYTAVGPMKYGLVTTGVYSIDFEYRRINEAGYGVTKAKKLSLKMDLTQVGASSSTSIEVLLNNGEVIPVTLTPSSAVSTVGYQLRDISTLDYITGADKSALNSLTDSQPVQLQGAEGVIFTITASDYLAQAYDIVINSGGTVSKAWTATAFTAMKLSQDTSGKTVAATKRKAMTQAIVNCVKGAVEAGADYTALTWYQLQYAMLNTGDPYVDNATAKAEIEQYSALMDKING